jgi:hypothetical protein
MLSCLQVEPLHISDDFLLLSWSFRRAVAGMEIVPLFPEMGLDVFYRPMLSGDPSESFRAEADRLGNLRTSELFP